MWIAGGCRADGRSRFPLSYYSRTLSLELQGDPRRIEEDIPGRHDGVALREGSRGDSRAYELKRGLGPGAAVEEAAAPASGVTG